MTKVMLNGVDRNMNLWVMTSPHRRAEDRHLNELGVAGDGGGSGGV